MEAAAPACGCCVQAVEMKQVAEQDAERARFVVLKAEQVRRQQGTSQAWTVG